MLFERDMTAGQSDKPQQALPAPPQGGAPAGPLAVEPVLREVPILALVGRPNVGKSTLFNRLTRSRDALVAAVPGVTRDRREALVEREDLRFRLVDTGGMAFDKAATFGPQIQEQILAAVGQAGLVWLIVDAAEGVNPYDEELARVLRASGRPWLVIANKAEGPERLGRLGEFFRLGAADVRAVSALQGSGISDALAAAGTLAPVLRRMPEAAVSPASGGSAEATSARPGETDAIRVAFVGRPNVGKSSLLNAILGEPRFIVSDVPGTTREAVDVEVIVEGERYRLVDTAGLRRKARTTRYLDKLSAVNTLQALDRAEVAVLVLDATEGAVDQDAHIAGHILERGRACVLALNKWDLVVAGAQAASRASSDVEEDIEHALSFLHVPEVVRLSALAHTGLKHLFRAVRTAHRQYSRTVATADLNRVLHMVTGHTPPPARGRSPTRVQYGVQTGTRPPAFRLFTNHPEQVRKEYTRFIEQQLRYHLGLEGTPLRIEWRGKDGGTAGSLNRPARPRPAGPSAPKDSARRPGRNAPKRSGRRRGAKPYRFGKGRG